MAEEDAPQGCDQSGVQRVECSRRVVVAVLCDAKEEVAVPASPDVGEVAEVVQTRRVPAVGVRMPIGLEEEEGENRRDPDRRAAPEVDVQRLPLTRAHGRMIILSNPRTFTPEEANEALVELRPIVERMVQHRRTNLTAAQVQQAELVTRIAGNGGDMVPSDLHEAADTMLRARPLRSPTARSA